MEDRLKECIDNLVDVSNRLIEKGSDYNMGMVFPKYSIRQFFQLKEMNEFDEALDNLRKVLIDKYGEYGEENITWGPEPEYDDDCDFQPFFYKGKKYYDQFSEYTTFSNKQELQGAIIGYKEHLPESLLNEFEEVCKIELLFNDILYALSDIYEFCSEVFWHCFEDIMCLPECVMHYFDIQFEDNWVEK